MTKKDFSGLKTLGTKVHGRFAGLDEDTESPAATATLTAKGEQVTRDSFVNIEISKLYPDLNQPRKDADKIDNELLDSIAANGITEPITVKKENNGDYTIIKGERRYTHLKHLMETGAAEVKKKLGRKIPCIIKYTGETNEGQILLEQILENSFRKELNIVDQAEVFNRLRILHGDVSVRELAQITGYSKSSVGNYYQIYSLPKEIKESVQRLDTTGKELLKMISKDDFTALGLPDVKLQPSVEKGKPKASKALQKRKEILEKQMVFNFKGQTKKVEFKPMEGITIKVEKKDDVPSAQEVLDSLKAALKMSKTVESDLANRLKQGE